MHNSGPSHHGESAGDSGTAAEIACRQFVELVTDYFEGALESRTVSRVEEHLVACSACLRAASSGAGAGCRCTATSAAAAPGGCSRA